MEEGNIKEHKNYLKLEEEKRKRARLVRTAVEGPLLRWVSKAEEVTVRTEPEPTPHLAQAATHYPYSYPVPPQLPNSYPQPLAYPSSSNTSYYNPPHPPSSGSTGPSTQMTFIHYGQASGSMAPVPTWLPPVPQAQVHPLVLTTPTSPPKLLSRTETVAKNYVVHETSQDEGTLKPPWKETMAAMFGDHVRWEELRAYAGRNRPTSMNAFSSKSNLLMTLFQAACRTPVRSPASGQNTRIRAPVCRTRMFMPLGRSPRFCRTITYGAKLWGVMCRPEKTKTRFAQTCGFLSLLFQVP